MKATIITFHCTPNYGATLQSVAMYKVFSKYFNEVELLDYRPSKITKKYNYIYTERFRGFIASLLNVPTNMLKYHRFSKFLKSWAVLTKDTFHHDKEISVSTDCLVLGSDQIWNFDIAGYEDFTYFGRIQDKKYPTIAYAASIGNDDVSNTDKEKYSLLVSDMTAVGVRENQAKQILIDSHVNKEIEVVLDPTLLVPKAEWIKMEKKITDLPNNFVLVYSLLGYEETYKTAEVISKAKGLPIIEILGRNIDFLDKRKHRKIATAGPGEFIYALDKADYVVTDSFHGTAFSVIFEKKFLVIPHKKRGSRMIELLTKLSLSNRIVNNIYTFDEDKLSFTEETKQSLANELKKSESFITQSINLI